MLTKKALIASLVILMLAVPLVAQAEDDPLVTISTSVSCNQVEFSIDINGDTRTYDVEVEYGDGLSDSFEGIPPIPSFTHSYDLGDSYDWKVKVKDVGGDFEYEEVDTVQIGPVVDLTSDPFPPLLTLMGGEASIIFSASVSGGTEPYSAFSWDIIGDGVALSENEVSYTYTEGVEFTASVSVIDECGIEGSDELKVVIIDPDEEPEKACHPTALKIAEAVSGLPILQREFEEGVYTCEYILDIFNSGTDTYFGHVGFGRLWHAYQLNQVIDELTWEEIRDWQLDGGFGWGSLLQLNRFADAIDDVDIRNLMGRVILGENSIGDIRTAVRSLTRYQADFEDVLTRLGDGANSGELNQFYRLAQDLGVDAAELDGYMDNGMSLAELRQASKLAERMDVELTEVTSVGVAEFRSLQRVIERAERETARDERTAERIAERLAEQFEDAEAANAMSYFEECDGKWGCVRKKMREQEQAQTQATTSQENRRAAQFADQFGVSEEEVLQQYAECGSDWGCVRAHYQDKNNNNQGKGKNKKK
ncbi:MAG: hypothetical protein ABUK16_11985 [Anaerolineales bacterium]